MSDMATEVETTDPVVVVNQGPDETVTEAAIGAQVAATVAIEEAANAQEVSEVAAELAAAGAEIGMAATEAAEEASAQAESAKSEVAQLREWAEGQLGTISAGLKELLERTNPPEKAEVEDVSTGTGNSDVSDGESTGSGGNKDSASGEESDRSGTQKSTEARKAGGFRRGRR